MNEKIFGYTWDEIQAAQQGGRIGRRIDLSKPAPDYAGTLLASDRALLAEHGEQGLRDRGYHGVLDRLGLL